VVLVGFFVVEVAWGVAQAEAAIGAQASAAAIKIRKVCFLIHPPEFL
jgi:hypothetical protein